MCSQKATRGEVGGGKRRGGGRGANEVGEWAVGKGREGGVGSGEGVGRNG